MLRLCVKKGQFLLQKLGGQAAGSGSVRVGQGVNSLFPVRLGQVIQGLFHLRALHLGQSFQGPIPVISLPLSLVQLQQEGEIGGVILQGGNPPRTSRLALGS